MNPLESRFGRMLHTWMNPWAKSTQQNENFDISRQDVVALIAEEAFALSRPFVFVLKLSAQN